MYKRSEGTCGFWPEPATTLSPQTEPGTQVTGLSSPLQPPPPNRPTPAGRSRTWASWPARADVPVTRLVRLPR